MMKQSVSFIKKCLLFSLAAGLLVIPTATVGASREDGSETQPGLSNPQGEQQPTVDMPAAQRTYSEYAATLLIGGIEPALDVVSIRSLGAQTQVIDYREASDFIVRKLPGPTGALILTVTLDGPSLPAMVRNWIAETHNGAATKRLVTVSFRGERATVEWTLSGCFPSGLSISSDSELPGPVFTSLSIACDRLIVR